MVPLRVISANWVRQPPMVVSGFTRIMRKF
jgi:hypothetical protein